MKTLTDPRHNSRTLAMANLFCWLFIDSPQEKCSGLSKELLNEENMEYDISLHDHIIQGVKKHIDEIDKIIVDCAPEWPIDKISKIDLIILRIAVFEVVFGSKAPVKVAIDEAVELAKQFGNDTSQKFVNGVLGTVVEKFAKPQETEEKNDNQ